MKILLITLAVMVGLIAIGFFGQWIRWALIPRIKDKIFEKKLKKLSKNA